jgi:hypothetical protein
MSQVLPQNQTNTLSYSRSCCWWLQLFNPLWLSFSLSENHLKTNDLTFPCSNSVEANDWRQRSVLLYESFLPSLLRKDRLISKTTDLPIDRLD